MPPSATDSMLAAYVAEIEDRQRFIDGLVEGAQSDKRDLSEHEMELITRAKDRIGGLNAQMAPLEEARRISGESAERVAQIARLMSTKEDEPTEVRYRSAGEYALDRWKAGVGDQSARNRMELFHRAAAHQTTGDNPGLLPEQVVQPVVNFIDTVRPLVAALGPRQLPAGTWSRPKVTQHTAIGAQTTEKSELVSQKMVIGKLPVNAVTYGGYVNVSRQNVDWSQPQVMDIVIGDLAAQYAIKTEDVAVDALVAGATAGPVIPTGAPSADAIAAAFWQAAGSVYTATKGAGRLIAAGPPQMLGLLGPLFKPVNPQNAQSTGFWASDFGQGAMGAIAGIPFYVTAGMADNTMLVLSTAAAEVYEDRIGSLQVVEPSVLGVQVAYAGYFAPLIVEATGLQKIVKTP